MYLFLFPYILEKFYNRFLFKIWCSLLSQLQHLLIVFNNRSPRRWGTPIVGFLKIDIFVAITPTGKSIFSNLEDWGDKADADIAMVFEEEVVVVVVVVDDDVVVVAINLKSLLVFDILALIPNNPRWGERRDVIIGYFGRWLFLTIKFVEESFVDDTTTNK